MEQSKPCGNDDDSNDVMKKEPQDLAGLLSSPDSKPVSHEVNANGVKAEPGSEIKEEIKEEIKMENVRTPGSVGKLPNGDANSGRIHSNKISLIISHVAFGSQVIKFI